MIPVLIFYIHTIFAGYAFCKSYQSDGLLQAFLNVVFIIILFAVGWTISDLIVGLFISANGYTISIPRNPVSQTLLKISGFYVPRFDGSATITPKDSVSLIILSVIEYYFYKFYFRKTNVAQ